MTFVISFTHLPAPLDAEGFQTSDQGSLLVSACISPPFQVILPNPMVIHIYVLVITKLSTSVLFLEL